MEVKIFFQGKQFSLAFLAERSILRFKKNEPEGVSAKAARRPAGLNREK
jgi:hypothetical protein